MTGAELEAAVVQALVAVAPEIDPATLQRAVPLRDQVDLDSMDFLRFVMELHTRTGVAVPESDYVRLASIEAAAAYLAGRAAA